MSVSWFMGFARESFAVLLWHLTGVVSKVCMSFL